MISLRFAGSKIFLVVVCLLLLCSNVFAQVKFYCKVSDKNIAKNETVQVDYIVENAGSINDMQLPGFKDFAVLSGPNESSQSMNINGKSSSSYTISFLLQPKGPGRFTIPAASARINNKQMQTNTVEIVVDNRMGKNKPQQATPPINMGLPQMLDMPDAPEEDFFLKPNEDYNEKIKKNLLVVLEVSKTTCYVGEPIIATYKLCSRLKSESKVTKRPSLDGFSVYDMIDPQVGGPVAEKIGGKLFTVNLIRKVQLYPLQSGRFQLDPVELDNTVHFIRTSASTNSTDPMQRMMDNYGNQNWEDHQVTVASKPVIITVKPLPENKPVSFNGAVGNFNMEVSLSTPEIHAEDDAILSITISGAGNLPLINAPSVEFPKGFETLDVPVKEELDKTTSPISGSKKFDFNFVPSDTGTFTIASITFSYFDATANKYKTITSQPLQIKVLKALKQHKKGNKSTAPAIATSQSFANWWYYAVGGIIIFTGLFLFTRKKKKPVEEEKKIVVNTTPIEKTKLVDAPKEEPAEPYTPDKDPLDDAKKALNENDSRLFFSVIQKTLWDEVSRKTQTQTSRLDKRTALQILQQKGVSDTVRTELESLLNTCEMALYMPQSTSDMQNVFYKTTFVISALKN